MESLAIILKLHTPEELIFYSNIAHWIEGAIFLIVAGIALLWIIFLTLAAILLISYREPAGAYMPVDQSTPQMNGGGHMQ